jgi:hypothetical protein
MAPVENVPPEERMETLETRLDRLQLLMKERLPQQRNDAKRGWQAIIGSFAEDPLYEEAMRLGREWRDSQHDQTR